MTKSAKSKLIRQNSLCWGAALVVPLILHFGLSHTGFQWPIVLPLLLFPVMLASNGLVSRAAGNSSEDSAPE